MVVRTESSRTQSARPRVDQPTISGRSCANSGHYKPLFACVDRTFPSGRRCAFFLDVPDGHPGPKSPAGARLKDRHAGIQMKVALYQWRPSIRAKAVVDAELHSGDGLLHVNPRHNFGDTKNRSGQC
jgi:hypothetical protein